MLLRQMNERAQHTYVPSFDIAIIYAGLGDIPASMSYAPIGDSKTCSGASDYRRLTAFSSMNAARSIALF
jgi:hypothetical protein